MNAIQNEVVEAMKKINDEIMKLVGLAVSVTVTVPSPVAAKPAFGKEELFGTNKSVLVVQADTYYRLQGPDIPAFIVTGKLAGNYKHAEAFQCREDAEAAADLLDSCSIWAADVKMAQDGGSLWGKKPYAYVGTKRLLFRRNGQKVVFEEVRYSLI